VTQQLEEMYPRWVLKRLPPSAAGKAIVQGIERRAPRIILPRWWRAWSTFRGIINPALDRAMERDDRVLAAIRMGEESPPT
jgi:hypothetical protein